QQVGVLPVRPRPGLPLAPGPLAQPATAHALPVAHLVEVPHRLLDRPSPGQAEALEPGRLRTAGVDLLGYAVEHLGGRLHSAQIGQRTLADDRRVRQDGTVPTRVTSAPLPRHRVSGWKERISPPEVSWALNSWPHRLPGVSANHTVGGSPAAAAAQRPPP